MGCKGDDDFLRQTSATKNRKEFLDVVNNGRRKKKTPKLEDVGKNQSVLQISW